MQEYLYQHRGMFYYYQQVNPFLNKQQTECFMIRTSFQSMGYQTVAFAKLDLPREKFPKNYAFTTEPPNFPTKELCFLGLVALTELMKPGVRAAVTGLRKAGVQIVMVSEGESVLVEAIARKVGILSSEGAMDVGEFQKTAKTETTAKVQCSSVIINADQLETMSDVEWDAVLSKEEIIVSGASPIQKLSVVTRLQAKGHIVGVIFTS